MNAKRKAVSPKEKWQVNRRRYTWHLRPPFKTQFDRSHWWKETPGTEIEPIAALYELARRHPLVSQREPIWPPGQPRIPLPSIFEPQPSLRSTRILAMKSWPKLTKTERTNWKSSVGKLKGFDFRPGDSICISVTKLADSALWRQRRIAQLTSERLDAPLGFLRWLDTCVNPPTASEWESAIAQCAVEAYRKGCVLLAVAPDLAPDKAASVMMKAYREHLRLYPPAKPAQRAYPKKWLRLIAEFEDDETSLNKAKSPVFNRYRRVLDGLSFT
jgi:hypothetical protein